MGDAKHDKESVEKREKMKGFLNFYFGVDDIQKLNKEEIDKVTKGENLISRL